MWQENNLFQQANQFFNNTSPKNTLHLSFEKSEKLAFKVFKQLVPTQRIISKHCKRSDVLTLVRGTYNIWKQAIKSKKSN